MRSSGCGSSDLAEKLKRVDFLSICQGQYAGYSATIEIVLEAVSQSSQRRELRRGCTIEAD
ncbi:hypothetical protein E4U33_004729 [Claviceps sp. LM78 group G4]|nr:hypothetical protein E4U33_004729 [Claviceps sp. LM78 group G4]